MPYTQWLVAQTGSEKMRDCTLMRLSGISRSTWRKFVLGLSLAGSFYSAHAAQTTPEEIVAKHLESIGTAEARAGIRSRAVQGKLRFKILVGGGGEAVGSWGRVSEQRKSNFVMRFGNGNWRGEQFVFDGDRTSFAAATSTHDRSTLAQFVNSQDFIVKEGLLGGELSTAWALQNLDRGHVKLGYLGLKKVDGRELQCLEYVSKGTSDMSVKLYFDPETHRHLMTVYSVSQPNFGGTITNSAHQREIRFTLVERFNDFQGDNGITLPRHYDLQFTEELQNGATRVYDWDMNVDKILSNLDLDPRNFLLN
jgi:hypothetical protein